MNSTPRRPRYSVDGFVPNTGNRHVGFDGSRRPLNAGSLHGVRHQSAAHPITPPPAQQPADPERRSTFPDFTTYTGTPGAGSGHRLRGSRRPDEPTGKRSFWRRHNWKILSKRGAAILGVLLVLCGGWIGWKLIHTSGKVLGDGNLIAFLSSSKLRGEDQGRVNILLAGVSTDDPGHDGANLTDSIMIMSLDTKNHKASLLSIPRDLWVKIPGYGHSKINAANAYGDQDKFSDPNYPSGGMGLLQKTLSQSLQIPIHYQVKIDYTALRDAVNAVGGITVNIQSEDKRGLYDPNISAADHGPLKLPNGVQKIDGQTALNLARARGDPTGDGRVAYGFANSDFARTEHQRMELVALKSKINSPGVIANPLKIGQLVDAIGNHVTTNFKPSEIHRLYDISKEIKDNNIQSIGLNDVNGKDLLASYRTSDGASALIPAAGIDDFSQIQLYLSQTLSSDQTRQEAANVVVLNGGNITGLASKEGNILTSKGMNVTAVADAPQTQTKNTIIDQSKNVKPATKAKLIQLFGNTITTTPMANYPNADFIVILGTSQQSPESSDEQE